MAPVAGNGQLLLGVVWDDGLVDVALAVFQLVSGVHTADLLELPLEVVLPHVFELVELLQEVLRVHKLLAVHGHWLF